METPRDILSRYWNFSTFRPLQEEIINSILDSKDTLALLPTGGGKSICFQVPAIIKEGVCVVISPLIALMKDQVENLKRRGIKALAIYSGMSKDEIDIALNNAIFGDYKFLYMSPERLQTDIVRVRLEKILVNFLVVDEAHCISQWGYDFRPSYLDIPKILEIIGDVPIVALTATATPQVAVDIMDKLRFKGQNIIKSSFYRANLAYIVREVEDKNGQLLKLVKAVDGAGIIYVRERRKAEEVASFLIAQGVDAQPYHAGIASGLRAKRQDDWKSDKCRIIVATNAFGMGIDKSEVKFVCHYDMPDCIEAYFQEAGRAGRDGSKSYALLLWNKGDIRRMEQILRVTFPEIDYMKEVYQKLFVYLEIAYGSGKGQIENFDIMDFCRKMKLHSLTAYYAIKYIQQEGYWELTEEIDNPSRIMFTVNRDELYKVQLNNVSLDAFIKTILRMYTGLFSHYVAIDEEYIARVSRNSKSAITSSLIMLSRMHILSYIPSVKTPLLILSEERLDNKNLYISQNKFDERKKRFEDRMTNMFNYAQQTQECRSGLLLDYFGENNADKCETCDICTSSRYSTQGKESIRLIEKSILSKLEFGPCNIQSLLSNIDDDGQSMIKIIRDMIDRGVINQQGDMIYTKK